MVQAVAAAEAEEAEVAAVEAEKEAAVEAALAASEAAAVSKTPPASMLLAEVAKGHALASAALDALRMLAAVDGGKALESPQMVALRALAAAEAAAEAAPEAAAEVAAAPAAEIVAAAAAGGAAPAAAPAAAPSPAAPPPAAADGAAASGASSSSSSRPTSARVPAALAPRPASPRTASLEVRLALPDPHGRPLSAGRRAAASAPARGARPSSAATCTPTGGPEVTAEDAAEVSRRLAMAALGEQLLPSMAMQIELIAIWSALGIGAEEQLAMVRRHARLEVRARLPRIPALWRAAAEQLVTREEALLAFARFEAKVSAPERLLDRRRSGHLGRETARRAVLRERLVEADAKITATMGRLERVGDSLAFHGELYRRKMRTDEGQLRQIFLRQQRVAAEVDEVEETTCSLRPAAPPR